MSDSLRHYGLIVPQAPQSMGSVRQEYWSGLPFPTPGDLPEPGIEPTFLPSPALAGGLFTTSTTGLEGKVQRLESSHGSQGGTKNKAVGRKRFKRSYAVYNERIPSQMFL